MKFVISKIWEYIKNTDKLLWLFCLSASALSLSLLSSLVYHNFTRTTPKTFTVQLIAVILGIIATFVLSVMDYHFLTKLWKLFVPASIVLMALTYTSIGITPEGTDNTAWLPLFMDVTFQPAELLKICFILTFSLHLSKLQGKVNSIKNFPLVVVHGMIPIVMVNIQGDTGTGLVFVAVFVFMLIAAGLQFRIIIPALAAVVIAAPFVWKSDLLKPYQKERIIVGFNPDLDPKGAGYQQIMGRMSLGSGQLTGNGLFKDNSIIRVPELHNDFIFSYVGQALGFMGCMAVIIILTVICIRLLQNSFTAKDKLGSFICTGVFAIIIFQSVVNIGMVLCVAPVIGITLPLISCGGTSVTTTYILIGLVMSVHAYSKRKKKFFED